jgi:parallel beta-helix repeat protein
VPQSVVLTAAEDSDYLNETAVFRVSADTIAPADVTAVEADNDPVPPVIYVDDDANGANDGSSWSNAFIYLQDALYAVANIGGDVNDVWVAQGTYKPDRGQHQTPGDRNASFYLQSGVTIYGGFAGFGAPEPNIRDPKNYQTILSGDLNGDDFSGGDPNENSYHVVTASGTGSTAILDGFTVTAGKANGSSSRGYGAGMYNSSGSPTLINCTFSENSAYDGSGIYNYSGSSPTLTNCTFSENSALSGSGGGMFNGPDCNPTLTNCTFSNNDANTGGGGMYNQSGSPTVTNCTFTGNSATSSGGGMCNLGGGGGNLTVTNCTFS